MLHKKYVILLITPLFFNNKTNGFDKIYCVFLGKQLWLQLLVNSIPKYSYI